MSQVMLQPTIVILSHTFTATPLLVLPVRASRHVSGDSQPMMTFSFLFLSFDVLGNSQPMKMRCLASCFCDVVLWSHAWPFAHRIML